MESSYIKLLFLSINTVFAFAAFYEGFSIAQPKCDGLKQKSGLSKIECILVCQREKMIGAIQQNQCFCLEDSCVSSGQTEGNQGNQPMTVFRKIFKKNQCDSIRNACNAGNCIPSNSSEMYTCQCPNGISGTRCTEGQYFVDNDAKDAQYNHASGSCYDASIAGFLIYSIYSSASASNRFTLGLRLKLNGISGFNTIVLAKLYFTAKASKDAFFYDIKVKAMKRADSSTNIEQCEFRNDALRTSNQVIWSGPHSATAVGDVIETPNISAILNEVISMKDWSAGNHVDIVFFNNDLPDTSSTESGYYIYTGHVGGATKPKLLVTFA